MAGLRRRLAHRSSDWTTTTTGVGIVRAGLAVMAHRKQEPRFLCSELVSVLYEDSSSKRLHRTVANLEEISPKTAALLSDRPFEIGTAMSLTVKRNDLYGTAESNEYDPILGWFTTIRFDKDSRWSGRQFVPEHFLALCSLAEPKEGEHLSMLSSKVFTRTKESGY